LKEVRDRSDDIEDIIDALDDNENDYDNNGNTVNNTNRNEDIIAAERTKAVVKEWTVGVTGVTQIDDIVGYDGHY